MKLPFTVTPGTATGGVASNLGKSVKAPLGFSLDLEDESDFPGNHLQLFSLNDIQQVTTACQGPSGGAGGQVCGVGRLILILQKLTLREAKGAPGAERQGLRHWTDLGFNPSGVI